MRAAKTEAQNSIPGEEIAELFRRAIRREVKIVAVGKSWKDVYAGDVTLRIGDYEVVLFNDCDELDYADSATAPDGRRGEFDQWWEAHAEPVSLLTETECAQLEHRIERAPVTANASEVSSMPHLAHGPFTVDIRPLTPPPAEGVSRYSLIKQIHGDLEATSIGEMFSAGDPKQGAAGYVAIEVVTGTLGGRQGSFALQHFATMDASGPKMQVIVVPGSGTGDLKGLAGNFTIHNDKGAHSYDFDYTLP